MPEESRQSANAGGTESTGKFNLVTEGLVAAADHEQDTSPSRSYERYAISKILELLGNPALRIELWDGFGVEGTRDARLLGTVRIKTRSALNRIMTNIMTGMGDEYSAGRVEVDGDLVDVLTEGFSRMPDTGGVLAVVEKVMNRKPRLNTLNGSRANIHHHYNIDNEFYRLWLDHEMQYTCAYFARDDYTLEDAQLGKMDHVCRKLQLKPGDRVVEAGCGWGGLARHMALYYGAKVTAYNISSEQIRYARERAEREGYKDRVEYVEDDYRNIKGEYDAFVSVGMLEHVGKQAYPTLGGVISDHVTETGRCLIHSIGRNKPRLMNGWIEKRIFPGAYPPALSEMMEIFESGGFSVLDVENLRLHYARTLEHWLHRFDKAEDAVRNLFDDVFVRAWRLYLSGSIASFLSGHLQLFQVVFARSQDNTVPWTRDHVYPRS
ncbi:MAG: class I SAM-dependent methyltransferase [Proteobacteria bacterium]|nr:MAG: class I SAM-dependent methyltransferase [Pseudomonadota bacterium]